MRSLQTILFSLWLAAAAPPAADAGEWTRIGPALGRVCALAAAPSRPSTIYAGMLDSGDLFQSLDSGRTWTLVHDGSRRDSRFNNPCVLAVDPRAPETVYVSERGLPILSRSTDGGRTWSPITLPPLDQAQLYFLVHHPTRSGTLYVSRSEGPLLRSTDGGRTWNALAPPSTQPLTALAVHPNQPDTLYGSNFQGFFRSVDGGATWATLRPATGDMPSEIVIDPRNPRTIFLRTLPGTIYRSTSGGAEWQQLNLGGSRWRLALALALEPGRRQSTLYVTTGDSILRSADGGSTWKPFRGPSVPLFRIDVYKLLSVPGAVLAGTRDAGIFRSEDSAVTWSLSSRGLAGGDVLDLELNPRNPAVIYAFLLDHRIFKTRNGGGTWNRLNVTEPGLPSSVAGLVDPVTPAIVYAVRFGQILRSTDAGATWTTLPGPACTAPQWIEADPRQPSTIYTGGDLINSGCCAVWKSPDRGTSWSCIANGLPERSASAFAVDPVNPATLYAISGNRLHRSADGGATWAKTSDQEILEEDLAIDPLNPAILYAGAAEGVARSADRGQTWEIRGAGLPEESFVRQVEIDPVRTTTLYAAVAPSRFWPASSVYKSIDSGQTWAPLSQELLEVTGIFDLVVDPVSPSTIYIGTGNWGIMKLTQEAP